MSEMSHEDAVAALTEAANADASEQAPAPVDPPAPSGDTESTPPVQPQEAPAAPLDPLAQQVRPAEPKTPTPDTFDGGEFNPDDLPPELQAGWKQLQAAYTRKTQEIAEQRQQYEALGDVESLQQAAELYNRISDPQSWPALYNELTAAMQAYGLTPQEAQAAAAEVIDGQQSAGPDLGQFAEDPEMAPLVQMIQEQQARLDQFEAAQYEDQQTREAEQLHAAMVGELTRQETAIRQVRPDYTDGDINSIYQLSSFYNGNLIEAQHAYEDMIAARMERYVDSKQSAAQDHSGQPPAGAEVLSDSSKEPETLEEATEWAIEHLRNLQAQGEELGI